MRGRVFISYVHEDEATPEKLRSALEEAGIAVWRKDDIAPGLDWRSEIRRAITDAA
jgi:hypothetical protein